MAAPYDSVPMLFTVGGVDYTFETAERLRNFLNFEDAKFNYLKEFSGYSLGAVFARFKGGVSDLVTRWDQCKTQLEYDAIREDAIKLFSNRAAGKLPFAGTPDAEFVLKHSGTDNKSHHYAFGLLVAARSADVPNALIPNEGFLEGVIHGVSHRLGALASTAGVGQERIDKLADDAQRKFDEFAEDTKRDVQSLQNEIPGLHKIAKDSNELFSVELARTRDEMKRLKEEYSTELALKKPIIYWATRHRQYRRRANSLAWCAYGGIAGAAAIISFAAWFIVGATQAGEIPPFWRLTTLAAFSALSLWAVRLTVRLWFSSLHLATDAEERKLMIETFLSMRRGDFAMNEKDSRLVLQHIYRSASDGIVKDDAAPSLTDFLSGRSITLR